MSSESSDEQIWTAEMEGKEPCQPELIKHYSPCYEFIHGSRIVTNRLNLWPLVRADALQLSYDPLYFSSPPAWRIKYNIPYFRWMSLFNFWYFILIETSGKMSVIWFLPLILYMNNFILCPIKAAIKIILKRSEWFLWTKVHLLSVQFVFEDSI